MKRRLMTMVLGLALLACCGRAPVSTPGDAGRPGQSPTTSSGASATPAHEAPRSATVTMSGDLLWHDTLWTGPAADAVRNHTGTEFDFAPLFAGMRPVFAGADFAICHEEVPFAAPGGPYLGYPEFSAPPAIGKAIAAAGWDACTTSSNHSIDHGFAGLKRTLDTLDAAKVLHTGTFRSPAERNTPMIYTTAAGVRIALVSGTYGTNDIPLPQGKQWSVAMLDADDMIARAKAAKDAGADIVLAAMHGGEEYDSTPNDQQVEVAKKLTASAYVDLVYGHHVHVVQPWTKINGKWVAYGLGNLIAQHKTNLPRTYEGVTARFTFTQGSDGKYTVSKAEYIPTYISHWTPARSARVYHVKTALANGEGELDRMRIALARTRATVTRYHPAGLIES